MILDHLNKNMKVPLDGSEDNPARRRSSAGHIHATSAPHVDRRSPRTPEGELGQGGSLLSTDFGSEDECLVGLADQVGRNQIADITSSMRSTVIVTQQNIEHISKLTPDTSTIYDHCIFLLSQVIEFIFSSKSKRDLSPEELEEMELEDLYKLISPDIAGSD